mmetsp:Transcript_714/g.1659  ORF Transcript_714/g.1659 Transcript_714/m.1659 type:complete len:257 (+) Transcript_714:5434-6204(+)
MLEKMTQSSCLQLFLNQRQSQCRSIRPRASRSQHERIEIGADSLTTECSLKQPPNLIQLLSNKTINNTVGRLHSTRIKERLVLLDVIQRHCVVHWIVWRLDVLDITHLALFLLFLFDVALVFIIVSPTANTIGLLLGTLLCGNFLLLGCKLLLLIVVRRNNLHNIILRFVRFDRKLIVTILNHLSPLFAIRSPPLFCFRLFILLLVVIIIRFLIVNWLLRSSTTTAANAITPTLFQTWLLGSHFLPLIHITLFIPI